MSGVYRRIEILESQPSSFLTHASIFKSETLLHFPFDPFHPVDIFAPTPAPNPFDDAFDTTVTDLIKIKQAPFSSPFKRVQHKTGSCHYSRTLCDRVSRLELGMDRVVERRRVEGGDRKYRWTAEIESPEKYEWTAVMKPFSHGIRIKDGCALSAVELGCAGGVLDLRSKKCSCATRTLQIKDPVDHGAGMRRQAYAKRAETKAKAKGKRKELSPQDAAQIIQMSFRAYLIRRSQALRSLRELAVAKSKLKEIRGLFNNFSYRHLIARNAEERQRLSERIILLLLTVDAIKDVDVMVRAARRSMADELEAMVNVVDPKSPEMLGSIKRRTFDMPVVVQKKIAAGVAEVVQMLDKAEKYDNETFEVCL